MSNSSTPPVPVLLGVVLLGFAADFTVLAATADSPDVVAWGLATSRTRPKLLRALLNGLAETAVRQGRESALMYLTSKEFGRCAGSPLTVTFQGPPPSARIVALSADCDP